MTYHCTQDEVKTVRHGIQASRWPPYASWRLSPFPPHLSLCASVVVSCIGVQASILTSLLGPGCFLCTEQYFPSLLTCSFSPFKSQLMNHSLQAVVPGSVSSIPAPPLSPYKYTSTLEIGLGVSTLHWHRVFTPMFAIGCTSGMTLIKNYLIFCLPHEIPCFLRVEIKSNV